MSENKVRFDAEQATVVTRHMVKAFCSMVEDCVDHVHDKQKLKESLVQGIAVCMGEALIRGQKLLDYNDSIRN